jgi:hypothetical protein
MVPSVFEDIITLHQEKKNWTATGIMMSVIEDIDATPQVTVERDIAQYIGKRRGSRSPKGKRIYFTDFTECTNEYREKHLVKAFRKACRSQGFYIVSNGMLDNTLRFY